MRSSLLWLAVTSQRAVRTATATAAILNSNDVRTTTPAMAALSRSDDGSEDDDHPGRAQKIAKTKRLP